MYELVYVCVCACKRACAYLQLLPFCGMTRQLCHKIEFMRNSKAASLTITKPRCLCLCASECEGVKSAGRDFKVW